jgi:hypothetical protein
MGGATILWFQQDLQLARETRATAVHWSRRYEPAALQRQRKPLANVPRFPEHPACHRICIGSAMQGACERGSVA